MANGKEAVGALPGAVDEEANLKTMSLGEHLDELRSRLVKSVLALTVIFFGAFAFANPIIKFLSAPILKVLPKGHENLHFTGPMDVFVANIKVAFITAVVAGAPIWIYQFWKFVEPALFPRERKMILPFMLMSLVLFFTGVSFCFFLMLPMALEFLITMGMEVGIPIITISDYLSLLILLVLAFGVMFETPLILVLLAMMDLISAETLTRNRKMIVVIILIVAAILTPPDPISQIALAFPTYIMFELSIMVIKFLKPEGKAKRTKEVTKT